ncbi:NB-ARC domain-containing protein [Streptomyces sp. NPDC002795]|uniref:NB-ARC domain-containing protein n=1 Tax=Streptomyces sp. NPDC002795 TaxID=3364665 RepID=UPI0036CA0AA9
MAVEVAALAASGATSTVVGLVVTEAWTQARTRIARLFGNRRQAGTVGADDSQLQAAVEELAVAIQGGDHHAVGAAGHLLRSRLRHALREGSASAAELVTLLRELEQEQDEERTGEPDPIRADAHRDTSPSGIAYAVPPALRHDGPPSQVPALQARFVNRSTELADLDGQSADGRPDATDGTHVDVRVLAGQPGVGKTALARHWAHRMRGRFPDGRLHVDFAALRASGDGGSGADVAEAVGHCLRSLGVDDTLLPPALAERTALFRSRTADLRLLLVLDDVTAPAQVRALIPHGPGSTVLATSTAKLGELTLDGARPLHLDPLTPDAALLLLADRCGEAAVSAEPEAARQVAALCEGLPVALHVAAARIATDRHLTLAALAAELADEKGRLTALSVGGDSPVTTVLDASYRQLPPEMARGYRLLSLIPGPGPVDAATAAAALDTDTPAAQILLDVLEDLNLLERTIERRYRFHGLVRLHARTHAAAEEPSDTERVVVRRVLTHYLTLTAFADRAVRADRTRIVDLDALLAHRTDPFTVPGGPRPLDWLEAERTTIVAILRAADEFRLHTPGWQLAEVFTVLFLHHRHLGDWQESLELGARCARAAVAPAAEARLRSLLSRPLMDLGLYDAAERELSTASACAEVAGDVVLHASVLEFSGRYWDVADPARAIDAYRRSMDLNRQGGERRGAAIAAFFLGRAEDRTGAPADALSTLRRARADLLELPAPDHRMAARATAALGRVLDHLGRTDEAVRELRSAEQALREGQSYAYEAEALLDLAAIAERPGADRSRLRSDLARALTIHEEMGGPPAFVAELHQRLRDAERADEDG